jgi:hypothetical protein
VKDMVAASRYNIFLDSLISQFVHPESTRIALNELGKICFKNHAKLYIGAFRAKLGLCPVRSVEESILISLTIYHIRCAIIFGLTQRIFLQ